MLISFGYDITLYLPAETVVLFTLNVHPSRQDDLVHEEKFLIEPNIPVQRYVDQFGNISHRIRSPAGSLRLSSSGLIRDSGEWDPYLPNAAQVDLLDLPPELLPFLLSSRYCEVDSELGQFAWSNFSHITPGWARVQAICNFVHHHLIFDYQRARANRTALEAFHERVGVCRDFTHLAIALCRCLNIPARYVTGYLGDIGIPPEPFPMDFCAWMEVYLDGSWHTFDPRNNRRRMGRIVVAYGRDASDVALTTIFGSHYLDKFQVFTLEADPTALSASVKTNENTGQKEVARQPDLVLQTS